jgi:hypothetical protein
MAINLSTLVNQTNPLQLCKAWVNFNGSTATIRSSYNVSSITKVGAGNYTVNFTTALTDANYSFCVSGKRADSTYGTLFATTNTPTTTSFKVYTFSADFVTFIDYEIVNVQVFGN